MLRSLGHTHFHFLLAKTCEERDTSLFGGPLPLLPESGRTRFLTIHLFLFLLRLIPHGEELHRSFHLSLDSQNHIM